MKIFPIPQKIKFSGTYCDLSKKTWIILPENSGFPLKQRIMEAAKEIAGNFIRQPRVCAGHLSGTEILAVMRRNSSVAPEGRTTLTVPTGKWRTPPGHTKPARNSRWKKWRPPEKRPSKKWRNFWVSRRKIPGKPCFFRIPLPAN